jgi:LCP family protein required for cell wall assembly
MVRLAARWARLSGTTRALIVTVPLAVIVVAGLVAFALEPINPPTSLATREPTGSAASTVGPIPTAPVASPPLPSGPSPDPLLGLDGRFTLLLLGSDYRPSSRGNRTDTIMLVSISPTDDSVAAVSIPRDTARFPLPDGTVFEPKINELYQSTIRRVGKGEAGAEIRRLIGSTLGVEIDAYALIGLFGVTVLVDEIGGVDVTLDTTYHDPFYWVNAHTQGVTFPAGVNHLDGARALIFARTRKGDSDFQRVRRQQQLVLAVAEKVLKRGLASVPALLQLGKRWVSTDLPVDQAAAIFELVASADLGHVRQDVFGPRYATKIPGTVNYELDLTKVRALVARWFAPVPGSPLGPPVALPPPAVSPRASPSS